MTTTFKVMTTTFKVGDRVICISEHGFHDSRTGIVGHHKDPKYGDKLIIKSMCWLRKTLYLEFEEIPPRRKADKEFYNYKGFKKLINNFRNEETAKLAKEFKTQGQEMKELQEGELKIFTTGADF